MFEVSDSESNASDLARMGRDQRGRVPDAGQTEHKPEIEIAVPAPPQPRHSRKARRQCREPEELLAAVAQSQSRQDYWTQYGKKLRRWHLTPRLVTFTPVNTGCPVDPAILDDKRNTFAFNLQLGISVDEHDTWRDEDGPYHHPFGHLEDGESSDGDYYPSRWTGWTDFWIREDCAPAREWNGERLLLEYCCGPQSKIGNPRNFLDESCKVIRYTENEDMRTDQGRKLALADIREFKGKHISLWGSMPCTGGSPWQYVNEAHYFRTGNHSFA